MYYVSKRGLNTCKKQMFSSPKSANNLMKTLLQRNMQMVTSVQLVILLVTSFQSNSRATHPISRVHTSNITCQKLQWSEIEPPQLFRMHFMQAQRQLTRLIMQSCWVYNFSKDLKWNLNVYIICRRHPRNSTEAKQAT